LKAFIRDFREMNPNRTDNYCCGGGGGFIAMPEYSKARIEAKGRRKAGQIRATGAKIVAVPCHNCMDQINDITRHFKLGTSNRHVCSLVEEALIMPPEKKGNTS
jgi:Fe-S oxidoreductase